MPVTHNRIETRKVEQWEGWDAFLNSQMPTDVDKDLSNKTTEEELQKEESKKQSVENTPIITTKVAPSAVASKPSVATTTSKSPPSTIVASKSSTPKATIAMAPANSFAKQAQTPIDKNIPNSSIRVNTKDLSKKTDGIISANRQKYDK